MKSNLLKLTVLTIASSFPSHAEMVKGSLLKTGDGSTPIEQVKPGQLLGSLTKDKTLLAKASVLSATESTACCAIEVDLGDRKILATENQTFYDPTLKKWIKAKDLTSQNSLLGDDMTYKLVRGSERKMGPFETMNVSVDGSHYLFSDGVLTHNNWGNILSAVGGAITYSVVDKGFNYGVDYMGTTRWFKPKYVHKGPPLVQQRSMPTVRRVRKCRRCRNK